MQPLDLQNNVSPVQPVRLEAIGGAMASRWRHLRSLYGRLGLDDRSHDVRWAAPACPSSDGRLDMFLNPLR